MLRFKKKDCHFKVDERKRTVVYWIEGERIANAVIDFLEEHNIDVIGFDARPDGHGYKYMMEMCRLPRKICGIATCAPEDTWDVELGRNIAFLRLEEKYYSLFKKALTRVVNYMNQVSFNAFTDFENMYNKHKNRAFDSWEAIEHQLSAQDGEKTNTPH